MFNLCVWFGFISYTAFVFWASTTVPEPGVARLLGPYDKAIHFAMYSLLFYISASAFHRSPLRRIGRAAAFAFVYASAVGALTEWLQLSIPGRTGSAADWVADFAGVATSMAFLWAWRSRLEEGYF